MMIIMKEGATPSEVEEVVQRLHSVGAVAHVHRGDPVVTIVIEGDREAVAGLPLEAYPGVDRVVALLRPYKLVSREFRNKDTVVSLRGNKIGGGHFGLIAGPCSVETREQTLATARFVKDAGATALRGGAFKPRTSPYSFRGLGEKGLALLAEVKSVFGLAIITEVMSPEQVPMVAGVADILQVGTRNMQNYALLDAVGRSERPVMLKRGMMSTIEELLMSAEYIMSNGNEQVMLCERGIRTFETSTRNTLDISAVPVLKELTHLPVFMDPSHASGKARYVNALSRASVAAGADGLLIEMHPHPEVALSDGAQSIAPDTYSQLVKDVRQVAEAVGRSL